MPTIRMAKLSDAKALANLAEQTFRDTFYRKFGFEAVGDHVFPVGNDPQRDVIMMRSLG